MATALSAALHDADATSRRDEFTKSLGGRNDVRATAIGKDLSQGTAMAAGRYVGGTAGQGEPFYDLPDNTYRRERFADGGVFRWDPLVVSLDVCGRQPPFV